MGIFLSRKNTLRCPECGGYADKTDGFKICIKCGCQLISQDEYQSYSHLSSKPIVTCPYCQATNVTKISNLSKAGSVALWGIFAMSKTSKQWHCNNCKSDF